MYVLAVPIRIVHYLCKETFHIGTEIEIKHNVSPSFHKQQLNVDLILYNSFQSNVIKHFCIVVIRRRSGCTLFVPKTHTSFYIEYYLYASFEDLLLARISFCCGINYETTLSYSS